MLGMLPPVSFFLALCVVLHQPFFFVEHMFTLQLYYPLVYLQDMWQCNLCGAKSGKGFGKRVSH